MHKDHWYILVHQILTGSMLLIIDDDPVDVELLS